MSSVAVHTNASLPPVEAPAAAMADAGSAAEFLALLTGSAPSALAAAGVPAGRSSEDVAAIITRAPRFERSTQPQRDANDDASRPVTVEKPDALQPMKRLMDEEAKVKPASAKETRDSGSPEAPRPQTSGSPATSAAASGDTQDSDPASQKKLRSSLQQELSRIDLILASIIHLAAPREAPKAELGAGGEVLPSDVPLSVLPTELAAALPQQANFSLPQTALPAPAANPNILQDIRSLVEELRSALQSVDAPAADAVSSLAALTGTDSLAPDTTPATDAVTNSPAAGVQEAWAGLGELLEQFVAQRSRPTVAPDVQAPAVPAATSQDNASLAAQIKSSILQVRDQLAQLESRNKAIFTQAQQNAPLATQAIQQSGRSIEKLFADALASNGLAAQESAAQPVSYAASATPAAATPSVAPVLGSQESGALFAAGIVQSQQSGGGSSGGESGGQQQGQPPAQPAAIASAAQAPAGPAAGALSFSRLLQQHEPAARPVIEQVTFQIKSAAGSGASKITIQLHPNELGRLDIELSMDSQGKTSVVVTVENRQTLEMLQRDAQGLARALADAGLQTDSGSLSFNLGGGQNRHAQDEKPGHAAHSLSHYRKSQPEETGETHLSVIARSYVVNVAEGLDIEI